MQPFLKQVARHYFDAGEISSRCFILPNRRSCVFLRKYLSECVAESRKPLIAPRIVTMNDFMYSCCNSSPADQVSLLIKLYECYKALLPTCEPLDDFIFWGGVLLSDFGDVDKYLVDAGRLFTNISDYRNIQDSFDYLEPAQIEALERLYRHFHGEGRFKQEFGRIWNILGPLYRSFNASLDAEGMTYDGKAYRSLCERLESQSMSDLLAGGLKAEKYIFVGLNALSTSEIKVMKKMRDARLAEFCWDYGSPWIRNSDNKSSFFMTANLELFGQDFIPDTEEPLGEPEIHVLSVPSGVGQAKQLPSIFGRLGAQGIETTVVLPDEGLLIPVLNSIPAYIADINVTMGYPMKGGSLWSLVNGLATLQTNVRLRDGRNYFYHRHLWPVLGSNLLRSLLSEEERQKLSEIKSQSGYYVAYDAFDGMPLCSELLRPMVSAPDVASSAQTDAMAGQMCRLLSLLASIMKGRKDMAMELDFVKSYYEAVCSLRRFKLELLPATWFRLLDRLVCGATVPFKGEPLSGLQIMGPLETRALDFRNVVILSCNEGMFPRRNVSSSFIPAELRRGFGLPTYEYQDAVWAYYFYRLIQRAEKVWLVCDSRTEGLNSGEESRYIKQLEMHFGAHIHRYTATAPVAHNETAASIAKTSEDIEAIKAAWMSPSSLQNYVACPAKFYYSQVKKLRAPEEVAESLDTAMIGNVYHKVMETLYTVPGRKVTQEYLASLLADDDTRIDAVLEKSILDELKTFEIKGRNIVFRDMIRSYVRKTISRDIELMRSEGIGAIDIIGLEESVTAEIDGLKFYGRLDRLDSLHAGECRIVDYKTGKVDDKDFLISDDNADEVVQKLFAKDIKYTDRPKIALQLYLYDRMVAGKKEYRDYRFVNSIYQPGRLFRTPVQNVEVSDRFFSLMATALSELIAEILDPEMPFTRTGVQDNCKYCDFKKICGR